MLLQALRAEIEMKNLNLQETLLVQKSVGTRSHAKKRCGNAVPTRSHPTTSVFSPICAGVMADQNFAGANDEGRSQTEVIGVTVLTPAPVPKK